MTQPAKQQYELVTLKAREPFPYESGIYRTMWEGEFEGKSEDKQWTQGEDVYCEWDILIPVPPVQSDAVAMMPAELVKSELQRLIKHLGDLIVISDSHGDLKEFVENIAEDLIIDADKAIHQFINETQQ